MTNETSEINLSAEQKRIMSLMSQGWPAEAIGVGIFITGKRVCNYLAMDPLERLGLIKKDGRWSWKATRAGLAWKDA